jgi:cytochrome c
MLFYSQEPQWRPHRRILAVAFLAAGILYAPKVKAQLNNASSSQQAAKAAASPSEVPAGKTTFDRRCAICHYPASSAQKIGPGLKALYARRQFADGEKVDDAGITRWIESGGKNMPGFKDALKPIQIRALIAYLKTL